MISCSEKWYLIQHRTDRNTFFTTLLEWCLALCDDTSCTMKPYYFTMFEKVSIRNNFRNLQPKLTFTTVCKNFNKIDFALGLTAMNGNAVESMLMQKRRYSIVEALELRLFCIMPSEWSQCLHVNSNVDQIIRSFFSKMLAKDIPELPGDWDQGVGCVWQTLICVVRQSLQSCMSNHVILDRVITAPGI